MEVSILQRKARWDTGALWASLKLAMRCASSIRAATEAHGGSRIHEIRTQAVEVAPHRWLVSGQKCWVSRLDESEVFVVFLRDPSDSISAVIVDADNPGISRQEIVPAGLGGWTWGFLSFTDVEIDIRESLLGVVGQGFSIFKAHFTRFRPFVTACALGAAAGVLDNVRKTLASKRAAGTLSRYRDNSLIDLGASWAGINSALLLAFHAVDQEVGDLTARLGKAHGVDTACKAVAALAPLVGAAGFQKTHPIAKARCDLAGLQYADGIHDALYRSGGSELLRGVRPGCEVRFVWQQAA